MTITNNVVAKASVAFVALAMAISLVAPKAQAAEVSDMSLDELIALVNQLQSQVGQTPAATGGSCVSIPAPLTLGSQGANVTALQNALIAAGQSIPAGATGYFGAQTQSALAAWQAANGVSPAVGYYGPITQAAMDAKCVPADGDDDDTDGDDDSDSDSDDLSGEASLGDVESNDGDDSDVEEGQEDAPVAEFEVEFENGDAMITRVDLTFVATGSEEDPWDTFDEISLWVDGDEVARMSAGDEDDYLDEDDGSLRFSGLDIVGMEDEPVTIVVGATIQGSVDDVPATWNVDMTEIRYVDADDVTSTEDVSVSSVDFTIDVEGGDDEIIVKTSSEDPDATTLQVEDDGKSDWMTVFAFDLDTDDSTNDIEVTEIPVTIVNVNDQFNDIVSDLMLVIDGEEYDDWSFSGDHDGSTTTTIVIFDTEDLVIEAGERVTAELQVEFKQLATPGASIQGIVSGDNASAIEAEGADDLEGGQLSGAATGDTHTLRASGAVLEFVSSTETIKDNAADDVADDQGVFTIKFDVTAFESDLYVNKTAASTTGSGSGAGFRITNGSNQGAGTSTAITASLTSTADSETGTDSVSRFVVNEGDTETFTLTVTYNPNQVGAFYGVQLYSLNYKTANTGAATVVQQFALPATDYESDPLSI